MAIKFTCPHCQTSMTVPDEAAGKRGKCGKCKNAVTVPGPNGTVAKPTAAPVPVPASPAPAKLAPAKPAPAIASVPAPTPPAPPPPSPPEPAPLPDEVEAAAAALFNDAPKVEEPAEAKTIDFECPMCNEPVSLDVSLADKKHPCPSCRRIIKVPPLKKLEKKDWRAQDNKLPLGAKRPDQPAPEGTWDAGATTRVGLESLEAAGALPQEPRTWREKLRPAVYAAAGLGVLLAGTLLVMGWLNRSREQRALKRALDYAASDKASPQDKAALHLGAGAYFVHGKRTGSADEARKQFAKALGALGEVSGVEHDALLGEMALLQVELGGSAIADLDDKRALKWADVQKSLLASLSAIVDHEARLDALRALTRRLSERDQVERVLPLVAQSYPATGEDRSEALAACGLELLAAGRKAAAEKLADESLAPYAKKAFRLRAPVVALAIALERKPPPPSKTILSDEINERAGKAEGLAARGKWDEALESARKVNDVEGRFRALVAVAGAALQAKTGDKSAAEAALDMLDQVKGRRKLSLALLRLARICLQNGLGEERAEAAIDAIADPGALAWGKLTLLRARLASAKGVVGAEAVEAIPAETVSQLMARQDLARHNVRIEGGWARTAQGWEGAGGALGSLGVARALQGEK